MKRIVLALALLPTLASAQVYKCTVNGKLAFQDKPCKQGEQETIEVKPSSGGDVVDSTAPQPDPGFEAVVQQSYEREKRAKQQARFNQMINEKKVAVGMTENQAVQSWGQPSKINRSSSGADQWVYRRSGSASDQYLYFENGLLRSWN